MSRIAHKEHIEAQGKHHPTHSPQDISEAVKGLDATIQRLRDRIIPSQPYLLSVPSDVPYRHSARFDETWYFGLPISAQEEQVQYSSFLPHQGDDETLLKVVGGWADERGNFLKEESSPLPASFSGHNTPSESSNRKKISLKDYKSKDKAKPTTPNISISGHDLPEKVMKTENQEKVPKVEEDRKPSNNTSKQPAIKKEKRDAHPAQIPKVDGSHSLRPSINSKRPDQPSPRKRRRLSTDSTKEDEPSLKVDIKREAEETKGLPVLLSPTLPAHKKDSIRRALPTLLLPDLPPSLEKAVADASVKVKTEDNSKTRSDQVKSILGGALGSPAPKRAVEKQLNGTGANRVRSDSQTSTKIPVTTPKVQSPASKPLLKPEVRPATPLQNGTTASPKPRQRHVIVLRYGKRNRKRVDALLKFANRPKKAKTTVNEAPPKSLETRQNPAPTSTEIEKADRKRVPDASPERPVKKLKQQQTPEKAVTPKVSVTRSPLNPTPSTKSKLDLTTPKKELKPSAMRRIASQDGIDSRTPQGDHGRTLTPLSGTGTSHPKASPGPGSSISKEERLAWDDMDKKYFALGRTLKHEGTSLGPSPGNERTEKDQALSVVLLIEALMCFMIKYTAQSQPRPSIDPGWSQILPYQKFVFSASRRHRHLHGLVVLLGAVCRQSIHHYDIERLARDPLPFEHCESAPTPGSDGNTKTNDDMEKYKKKYVAFRDQLVQNARELQTAWLDGLRYLSPFTIEREYPVTWAGRAKEPGKRGSDKIKPDAISKDYVVPLDINSSTFEAVRFGLSFLKEWSHKERIEWSSRIDL